MTFVDFFQFFKTLERTFSSTVDSHDSFKRKKVSNWRRKTFSSCIWHPTKGCFTNVKKMKNSAAQARPQTAHVLASATTIGKRSHGVYPLHHLVNHVCKWMCFIYLCLSYLILCILVSPRLQQELHNCGVTILRGKHESCPITLYKDERERRGTHHSSRNIRKTRTKEDENKEDEGETDRRYACAWVSVLVYMYD